MSPVSGTDATDMTATLVGREREMYAVEARLDAVSERGVAVLVRGEAGVGKSVLLTAARDRAKSAGMGVLRCRGSGPRRVCRSPCSISCSVRCSIGHRASHSPSVTPCWRRSAWRPNGPLRASSGTVVKSQRMG